MSENTSKNNPLHPRNRHNQRYDFTELIKVVPELKNFLTKNPLGEDTIPFANPLAVKLLNKAILLSSYDLDFWDIPDDQLCPPIPGRADYIHYLADLISTHSQLPKHEVQILDVGVGANLIYPIIGVCTYGWNFVGSDISSSSLENAGKIITQNAALVSKINLRYQAQPHHILKNIILPNDRFDAVLCNPPFFKSKEEALGQTLRKMKNLGQGTNQVVHNFGGQSNELWCKGGELQFVSTMIKESASFASQVGWFTSLVSNKDNLRPLKQLIKKQGAKESKIVEMKQGNKQTRFIAWRF